MKERPILIVDDEKNIRVTLSHCLDTLGYPLETARNGEEAVAKVKEREYACVLLDLRMPGMGGMEALKAVRSSRPDLRVIILTAHGTIETAVEAMKLGAVDFIQKPFLPDAIRDLVMNVMSVDPPTGEYETDYGQVVDQVVTLIGSKDYDGALQAVRRAMYLDCAKPQAFNLAGALMEIKGNLSEARKYFRAAYALDPTFEPARKNLDRTTSWNKTGPIDFG